MTASNPSRHVGWIVWLLATLAVVLIALFLRSAPDLLRRFNEAMKLPLRNVAVKDSDDLLKLCRKDRASCTDLISTAIEAERKFDEYTKMCSFVIPEDVDSEQLTDIVIKFMEQYPGTYDADSTVVAALSAAYPCPK